MIERQQLFFVATAPLGADGHVNMSPKGHRSQTFAVLGDNQVRGEAAPCHESRLSGP